MTGKIDEATKAHAEMRNFFNSLQIPAIILDEELKVRQFTTLASEIVNLIEGDVGRPVAHIVTNLKEETLVEDAWRVLRTDMPTSREVETRKGISYLMKILPYRTGGKDVKGVVFTFVEVGELKSAKEKMVRVQATSDFYEGIVDTISKAIIVLDHEFIIQFANRAFYRLFHLRKENVQAQSFFEFQNLAWNNPELKILIDDIVHNRNRFENFSIKADFPGTGKKTMLVSGSQVSHKDVGMPLILLSIKEA